MIKSYQVIFDFLSDTDLNVIMNFIENHAVWEQGRQGSGYEKTVVPSEVFLDMERLYSKSRSILEVIDEPADCYIIKYPVGSYIPEHKDPVEPGFEHWRLNAIIQNDEYDETNPSNQYLSKLYLHGRKVILEERDAIIFRPDLVAHGVSPINGRTRYVWSVGALKSALG